MQFPASPLQILQSQSLPNAVRDEITKLILAGKYAPGAKLGEEELADILGVSRGPIREAFRSLEEAGLVHLSKNRGVFVRQLTFRQALELYVVRQSFDEMVGRLLAPQIVEKQIAELRLQVAEMEVSFSEKNVEEYFSRDMEFHDSIVRMVNNSKLLDIYRRIVNEMHLVRLQSLQRGGGISTSNPEHAYIVDALASHDREKAAQAMGQHVSAAFQRVAPLLTSADEAAAS
jgi:DNA-binding GntR family transcriptional regulator